MAQSDPTVQPYIMPFQCTHQLGSHFRVRKPQASSRVPDRSSPAPICVITMSRPWLCISIGGRHAALSLLQWPNTRSKEAILETNVATVVIVWSDVVRI